MSSGGDQVDGVLRRLDAIQSILDITVPTLELEQFLTSLLERLKGVLDADLVALLVREGENLVVRSSVGMAAEQDVAIGQGIAGRAAERGETIVVHDVTEDPDGAGPHLASGIRSTSAVPLRFGEDVVGVLQVGTATPRNLHDDLVVLDLVARRAANALEAARLVQERTLQVRRLQLLAEFSHHVSAEIDALDRALQFVAERLTELIGDGCVVYVLSDDRKCLEPVALHHHDPATLRLMRPVLEQPLPVSGHLIGDSVRRQYDLMLAPEQRAILTGQVSVDAVINAPLRARGEVIGVVSLLRTHPDAPPYSDADLEFLDELAARAAVAIDNARLYRRVHESEGRFRALVDSSRIGFVIRDQDARVVEANTAYARMIGYDSAEELIGSRMEAVWPAQDVTTAREAFGQLYAGELDTFETQTDYVRRDGAVLHVRSSTSAVRDAAGRPLYTLSLVEDLSEPQRLEEQLRQAQKMEALGRFAGAIAHDFNNMLTAIIGSSDLLARELDPDHLLQAEVREIRAAGDRAAGLTRQLLTFSRREITRQEVLDAAEVVRTLAPMLVRLLGEDVELVLDFKAADTAVRADRQQIEQVILNLAVNARDAMPAGGRLAIEITTLDLDAVFARPRLALEPGRYVVLAVSDTGNGIDAETQRHIFEPFFTTKPVGKGTGLGLSTVFGIVQQSGGTISVYSEPGHGATFRIYLPASRQPAARPASDHANGPLEAAHQDSTVLVLDDEAAVRRIIQRLLERMGCTVLLAGDGDEALDLATRHPGPINLLISDIVLPGLPGPEVAERLRRLHPHMKLLYSSGYPGDEVTRRGLDPDAAFVAKPFAPDELVRAVSKLLLSEPR